MGSISGAGGRSDWYYQFHHLRHIIHQMVKWNQNTHPTSSKAITTLLNYLFQDQDKCETESKCIFRFGRVIDGDSKDQRRVFDYNKREKTREKREGRRKIGI